jgi:hypothetical protein
MFAFKFTTSFVVQLLLFRWLANWFSAAGQVKESLPAAVSEQSDSFLPFLHLFFFVFSHSISLLLGIRRFCKFRILTLGDLRVSDCLKFEC